MMPLALLLVAVLAPVMRPVDACHASAPFIEPMPHGQLHGVEEAIEEAIFDNCFLAGTNVETASRGGVAVEDVRVGDHIAPPPGHEGCADPRCGEVVRLFRNQTDQVVTITAVARPRAREHRASGSGDASGDGEDAEPPSASQTIRCTPGHPFFVEGRGWVFAGDLRAGDELEARGERVVVAAVEVRAERAATFNFEVRCHHTYFVSGAQGQPGVLVHNLSVRHRGLVRALRGAGFSRVQRRALFRGESVAREIADVPNQLPIYELARLTQGAGGARRLSMGILHIENVGGRATRRFGMFRTRAQGLARAVGANELELFGGAIQNPKIARMLTRQRFTPGTFTLPDALGSGQIDILSRVYPVR